MFSNWRKKVSNDIEYNITFPTVQSQSTNEQEPVVFLLGWVGCQDKILSKYSKIYEEDGCITIRYTHPAKDHISQDSSDSQLLQDAAEKLFQLLNDYDLKQHPILVHCFSNGGYWVYRYLADIFYVSDVNMVGLIADSCPGRPTLRGGFRTIWASSHGVNMFLVIVGMFLFACMHLYFLMRRKFGLCKNKPIYEYMQGNYYHSWPHLFLYSSGDSITPSTDIVDMWKARKLNGSVTVKKHDFVTSQHVSHMVKHPDEYRRKCLHFLNNCIRIFDVDAVHSDHCGDDRRSLIIS